MNKRRTVFLSSGLPSMFVIFSILCMVILSLLALGTSRQDLQTSQMSLDQTTAYYKACSDATAQYTEITEYIRKTAESASDKERYLSQMKNLEKNFKNTVWSRQSETFSLTLDYSDTLALYVEAKAEYAGASLCLISKSLHGKPSVPEPGLQIPDSLFTTKENLNDIIQYPGFFILFSHQTCL